MIRTSDWDSMLINVFTRVVRSASMLRLDDYEIKISNDGNFDLVRIEIPVGKDLVGFQFGSAPDVIISDDEIRDGLLSLKNRVASRS